MLIIKVQKKLWHGDDYKYPHKLKDHFVQQEYVPEGKTYYQPTNQGYEAKIKERLDELREEKENNND